jgi:cation transport protein ChaC
MAALTKEFLASDAWRIEANALGEKLDYPLWSDDKLRVSVRTTLEAAPPHQDHSQGVWIFGYGSLIWNPLLDYDLKKPALVHGYQRRFCLQTRFGRGSPDKPGLVLALDEGGRTEGRAFRLRPENLEHELFLLWRREMLSGSYRPMWIEGEIEGQASPLLTFVIDANCGRYTGPICPEQKLHMLLTGEGMLGTSMEYFTQTLASLRDEGIVCDYLEQLEQDLHRAASARATDHGPDRA